MEASNVPNANPSRREWKLEDIRKTVSSLLGNRNNAWWKSKFLVASKLKALTEFKSNFDGATNWSFEGHIRLIYRNRQLIQQELLPGAYSRNQKLASDTKDLLYGIEKYVENNPHLK